MTDGRLLLAAAGARNFAYSFLSVVLGPYLAGLGLGAAAVGWIFTAALAGSAATTIVVATAADRFGRRRILLAGSALMALGGAAFAVAGSPVLLAVAAALGSINPSGKELGPFLAVEMAALPQATGEGRRTALFAAYNVVSSLAVALGALAAGLPALAGLAPPASHRVLVWSYAAVGVLLVTLFARLSPGIEVRRGTDAPLPGRLTAPRGIGVRRGSEGPPPDNLPGSPDARPPHEAPLRGGPGLDPGEAGVRSRRLSAPVGRSPSSGGPPSGVGPGTWLGLHRSRGVVARLAALFALDAFAGGFIVQGLVAYWFHLRFGVGTAALGAIFFGANLLSALSYLAAAPIARRIGLLNTMVFTHLPSNLLLMLVPLMPSVELAAATLLARHLLSQLDVPARQSYVMAVVDPDERSAAAGLTQVARNAATALAPAFAGALLRTPALGLPFLVAGGLKAVYDLAILIAFRHVRPPEEVARAAAGRRLA